MDALEQTGNGGWRNETEKFEKRDGKIHVRTLSKSTDASGRVGLNSVFGEQIMGTRIAQVSGQFKYGIPSGASLPNIVGSGKIEVVDAMLQISTGTDSNGAASIANKRNIRYIPGYDSYALFTAVFSTGVADSYQRAGLFDDNDGFFIGYEGTTFGFTRRRLGVDTFSAIDMTAFEEIHGYALDPTKGNIYRINYGYLGFATIIVDVLNPNGSWVNLFKLEYPNSATETHITQTFLSPRFDIANTGNTTDLMAKSGSFNAGIIDGGGETPSTRSFTNDGLFGPLTGNQDIIAYRNKTTFNTFENKIPSLMTWLSLAVEGNKPFIIRFVLNPTETTPGTWSDINTNDSIMEYSTDTVYTSGTGTKLLSFSLAKVGEINQIIKDLNIEWLPEDTLLVQLETAATGYEATLGLKWDELF